MDKQTQEEPPPEKRNKALRQALHLALSRGLAIPAFKEFGQSYPDCTEEQSLILYDLYRQVLHQVRINSEEEFEEYCAEIQLWEKLSTLEQLEEHHKREAWKSKPGGAPREAALGHRVLAKRQEVEELKATLSKALEEQSAAKADFERRQAQIAKALDQYKPLADDLQKVHVASSQWIGRNMTLAA